MTVYLKTQGQLFNLSLIPNIKTEGEYLNIGGVGVSCRYKEVADNLFQDIFLALKTTHTVTFIESFTGEDKYTQQIKVIEALIKEKERQDLLNRVLDAIEKRATRCFYVKADAEYDVSISCDVFNLDEYVYANDEKIVEAWLRQTVCTRKCRYSKVILKEGTIEIKPAPNRDIFHCYAYLPYSNSSEFRFIYEDYNRILDAKDYEAQKEPV